MKKKLFCACLLFCALLFLQLFSQSQNGMEKYRQLFKQADELFNGNATEKTDSIAITLFTEIINSVEPGVGTDTLIYNCYERRGILKQGLGFAATDVLNDFHTALYIHETFKHSDSLVFRLMLSTGNIYYNNGVMDSAVYYFSKAENIINRYPKAGLAGDLYNSLGALYSEEGNYTQSGNYFSKALELTQQTRPDLKEAIFAMSANIASSVKLSGYADSALVLYKKLLDKRSPSLPIVNNIAGIYLTKKQPDSALRFLNLVMREDGNYNIGLSNAKAQAYMLYGDTANTAKYLAEATAGYRQQPQQFKNNNYAATCKYYGDLRMKEGKPEAALNYYQQAIIQYDYKFNETDPYKNPGDFIGDFASYNLFDALVAKANCFVGLYAKTSVQQQWQAAINTYDSAFTLADYIKKSIDNDEARLFIADKVFNAYQQAVDFILHEKKGDDAIKQALKWISKSRATSLAISLKENTIKRFAGLPDSLLQKEKNFKVNISRLKLQLQYAPANEQQNIVSQINTYQLQLQTLNNSFKQYPGYYNQKFAADDFKVEDLQQKILDDNTAAICYFKGLNSIHVFVIKQNAIVEKEVKPTSSLQNDITAYTGQLSSNNDGNSYNSTYAQTLYKQFFQPVAGELDAINALIVLPYQDIINLPFEAFEDERHHFLIEKYSVTYQYALPFIQRQESVLNEDKAIAFAPFVSVHNNNFVALSSSRQEVSVFKPQQQYIDSSATKQHFLSACDKATVIHLATHAVVNYQQPSASYIAFYPSGNDESGYKIFAQELYNLRLPNTQLVFLSACETGSGKLSQSEGALSISRAFAYAGCANVITSLWKAEDRSTAYISERFYVYAKKGYPFAEALQKAKIDLLKDASMTQYHSPQYWSHLVFIGDFQPRKNNGVFWWVVAVAVAVFIAFILIQRQRSIRNVKK